MELTDRQQYELLAAISARGEIPVKFTYLGKGAELWDLEYRDSEHSVLTDHETALMQSYIGSFSQVFRSASSINLIDLGCGNGLPAIDIIKALQKNVKVNYVSVDLSREMLTLASKNIKKSLPAIPITELLIDFESESLADHLLDIKQRSKLPNLLVNLGNTLGNYVNVSSVLTNFLQSMTLEDYLIIGNGLVNDQNPNKILEAYGDISRQAVTSPAHDLGVFEDSDDYTLLWNPIHHRVEGRIKLNSSKQLTLAGQTITLEAGDELLALQSRKYTESTLTKLLSSVGFRTELLTTNRNRSYALAMIQPTRYSAS